MIEQFRRESRFFSKITEILSFPSHSVSKTKIDNFPDDSTPAYNGRKKWVLAFKQILPLYIAINAACIIISILALMSTQVDRDPRRFSFSFLLDAWNHWDTSWYLTIAQYGYNSKSATAFFPLYPLLIHGMTYILHNTLVSGLFVANIAMLVALTTFYQLTLEDFGVERAMRAVFYMAIFPTGFFLAAVYNTSLTIGLTILCFYHIRQGNWWLAGVFGFFTSLNHSTGILLVFPFIYEYLRQQQFRLRSIRVDIASVMLIPLGIALYGLYCYYQFGDFLASSHMEVAWGRSPQVPWFGISESIYYIRTSPGLLSYQSLNNFINLIPDLFFLILGILSFAGPWRFPRSQWSYAIYAVLLWLFINLVPVGTNFPFPLASMTRYFLESFPTFILLAAWGKNRIFHMVYLFVCGPIAVYLLIHHLLGLPVL